MSAFSNFAGWTWPKRKSGGDAPAGKSSECRFLFARPRGNWPWTRLRPENWLGWRTKPRSGTLSACRAAGRRAPPNQLSPKCEPKETFQQRGLHYNQSARLSRELGRVVLGFIYSQRSSISSRKERNLWGNGMI